MPVGTEPLLPSYLHRLESGLSCLEPMGTSGTRAITVLTMLWTYTRGDVEQALHLASLTGDRPASEATTLLAARLRQLSGSVGVARVLAALASDVAAESDDDDEFDAAIDLIIAGLLTTPGSAPVLERGHECGRERGRAEA